jgi:glutaminase
MTRLLPADPVRTRLGLGRMRSAALAAALLAACAPMQPPGPGPGGIPATSAAPAPATAAPPATAARQPDLQRLVDEAHARFKGLTDGANADYIPDLAKVPADLFGVAIVTVDGRVYTAGDTDYRFSIQSVSKPFTAALVMQQQGPDALQQRIGVEPTGFPFNSIEAIALQPQRSNNPLVNAGAIAAVSMVKAPNAESKYRLIEDWLGAFAGERLSLMADIYASEAATNQGNRAIAALLAKYERIYADPAESVDVYTRQCSIGVSAKQLAVMGATLANGGVNPVTRQRVLDARHVPKVLAVMTMAGFYDEAGLWAYQAGLPAKTGVGGGIVAVVPGRMAIVGFSPRLNKAGNSIRATRAIEHIATALDANVFGAGR